MNKLSKAFTPKMLSTAAKKIFARCVTGLAVALVWNRFWDDARWTVTNYACFLLGAWFLASASSII